MTRRAEEIARRLDRERRFLVRRRLAVTVLAAIAVGLAPVLLMAAVDLFRPVPENIALGVTLAAVGFGFLALGVGLWRLGRTDPGRRGIALEIEDGCPEFMDALACAAELADQPPERLNALNLALLDKVADDLDRRDIHVVVARRTVAGTWLASMAGGLLLLAAALTWTAPVRRSAAHAMDRLRGTHTGITVEPGNVEVARGDDLHIRAVIHRGPQRASLEVQRRDGTRENYTLYPDGKGYGFELFGVHEPFTYRVVTPTQRSRRYRVSVFARPEVSRARIDIAPPIYTGRPRRTLEELADFTAAQNSLVRLTVGTNMECTVIWQPENGAALRFDSDDGREHVLELRILEDRDWRLVLDDGDGHRLEEPRRYHIECLRDFPPVITVQNPPEDAAVDKTGDVPFAVKVIDDYGVRSVELAYSINGRAWQREDIYRFVGDGAVRAEEDLTHSFPLDNRVDYGDVITYYVIAGDNAQPEPNSSRTQIRFLEIRPRQLEQLEEAQGEPGEKSTTLEVADLIRQQKELIRQTWDAVNMGADDPATADALAKSGGDLLMDTRRRFNKLKEFAGALSLGAIGRLFAAAADRMTSAELLLRQGMLEDSLTFQQEALSKLVAIEIEMLKNAKKQMGQAGGQGNQEQQPQQRVDEEDMEAERQRRRGELREQLDRLEAIQQRQEALNRRLAEQPRETSEAVRNRLAAEQDQLRRDTGAIREALRNIPEAAAGRGELEKAAQSMGTSAGAQRADQPANAAKHGQMASQFLERGRALLDEAREGLSGSRLQTARQQLDRLRQTQEQLRQDSAAHAERSPGAREPTEIAADQATLREQAEQLLRELDAAGRELENENPEAGRALAGAVRQARQGNVDGNMKRAENALRYGRSKRAGDYQEQVLDQLDNLGQAMDDALAAGSQPNAEELAGMLRDILEKLAEHQRQQQAGATPEEQEGLREAIRRQLEEMARQLRDPAMQELAREAGELGGGTGTDAAGQLTNVLSRAAEVLESRLFESSLQRKLQLARLAGRLPPDEYRKLVDEYFKSLGEADSE